MTCVPLLVAPTAILTGLTFVNPTPADASGQGGTVKHVGVGRRIQNNLRYLTGSRRDFLLIG